MPEFKYNLIKKNYNDAYNNRQFILSRFNDIHNYYYGQNIPDNILDQIEDYRYSPAHLINLIYSSTNKQDFLNKLTT